LLEQTDIDRKRRLRFMKLVATSLLFVAAIIFIVAHQLKGDHSWLGYVEAGAEAAMVGAIADWFAVTALFKHPMGLPIPHTAIIQKRKEQIGASLGSFVGENFLTRDVISSRFESATIAQRLGEWLDHESNAKLISRQASAFVSGVGEVLEDETIQNSFEQIITNRVQTLPAAVIASKAVDLVVEGGHHQVLFDSTLTGFSKFLEDNESVFREKFSEESPWWIPALVDDKVYVKIYSAVSSFVEEILQDPSHPLRDDFNSRIQNFRTSLSESPEMALKAEEWKQQILNHPEVRSWIGTLWQRTKGALIDAAKDPNSQLSSHVVNSVRSTGNKLANDQGLQTKVDRWIIDAAGYIADEFKNEVAGLIESTVNAWDTKETAERLELQVGRDLQFIRINGTIVGGLAGVFIYSITQLLG